MNLNNYYDFIDTDEIIKSHKQKLKENLQLNQERVKKAIEEINTQDSEYKKQFYKLNSDLDKIHTTKHNIKHDPGYKDKEARTKKLMEVYKDFIEWKKKSDNLAISFNDDLIVNIKQKYLRKRQRDDNSYSNSNSNVKERESLYNFNNNPDNFEEFTNINSLVDVLEPEILKMQFPEINEKILFQASKAKIVKEIPIDKYDFSKFDKLQNLMIKIKFSKINYMRSNTNNNLDGGSSNNTNNNSVELALLQFHKYFEKRTIITYRNPNENIFHLCGKIQANQSSKQIYLNLTNLLNQPDTPAIIYAKICFYRIYEDMITDSEFTFPKDYTTEEYESYLATIASLYAVREFTTSQY